MGRHLRRVAATVVATGIALAVNAPAAMAAPAWSKLAHVTGVVDLGGPRSDGKLVVAGAAKLWLMDVGGNLTPFAQGAGGYADDKGGEPYLAVSPGLTGNGCSFAPDDVYIERLHAPIGITKVDASGKKSSFVALPKLAGGGLASIAFDTTGDFGGELLVTGSAKNGEHLFYGIDCNGKVFTYNGALPANEGGAAVAPKSFGAFGGMYIVADELSGNIYAFGHDGSAQTVVASGLPKGGDIGVESLGFVPTGFLRGGVLFFADRLTPGGKNPGDDNVMTISSADLSAAGVQEGDLLAATEGGGQLIAVRCTQSPCQVVQVISTGTRAHGEGHLAFITTAPPPSPSPSPAPTPVAATPPATESLPVLLVVEIVVVVILIGLLAVAVVRRR